MAAIVTPQESGVPGILYIILLHLPASPLALPRLTLRAGSASQLLSTHPLVEWHLAGETVVITLPAGIDTDSIPVLRVEMA